jgi:tripartite-type tricarboxylate transporter receptor subunit TctC
LAPAKTPPAVIAKLNRTVNTALADPQVRQKLVQSGAIPVGGTPQELGMFLKTEYEKWGRVVAAHHITEAP